MSISLDQTSDAYRDIVRRLAEAIPTYKTLDHFVNVTKHTCQNPPKVTIVSINPESPNSNKPTSMETKDFIGPTELAQYLASPGSNQSCRLFLIENLCPDTIAILGGHFDMDPQFFADHIDNTSWYRIMEVADHIPALPSRKKTHDFLQLRHIETRIFTDSPKFKSLFNSPSQTADIEAARVPNSGYESTTVLPDITTTRIPRKAGRIIPKSRKNVNFEPLLCTRQVVTVWFQNKSPGNEWWTGVILLDPPFQLPRDSNSLRPTEYRSFLPRPSLHDPPSLDKMHTHVSIRQAMIYHLEHRLSSNPSLLNVAVADCFFILEDIYRLVASEWVVLDEYMDRELATVEYSLEKELPEFRELESFLKYLYIYRRRTQRYHELISETKAQCSQRGQKRWHCDTTSTVAAEHAQDLEDDFVYLQTKTQSTMQRIEKDIDLLTALVAIGEGKQALDENRGVARLTFLAIFFLPFSTVATVLSMSGNFAPGATQFWIFWAVALPLITLIIIFFRFQYFTKL